MRDAAGHTLHAAARVLLLLPALPLLRPLLILLSHTRRASSEAPTASSQGLCLQQARYGRQRYRVDTRGVVGRTYTGTGVGFCDCTESGEVKEQTIALCHTDKGAGVAPSLRHTRFNRTTNTLCHTQQHTLTTHTNAHTVLQPTC